MQASHTQPCRERESKNLWDITKVDTSTLPNDINLITYGFPCQDISLAGCQKGFEHNGERTRSGLFFEALRIIEDTKPDVAIAENVKNLVSKKFSKEFSIVLTSLENAGYNNYWQVLNAKDYGIPQNRERVFIVSIRKDIDKYDFLNHFPFPVKQKLNLRLKDMLEKDVDEKYYLSEKALKGILKTNFSSKKNIIQNKDFCDTLLARDYKDPKCISALNNELFLPENTKKGYTEAHDGDGVYLNRPYKKRGVVQKGMIQTLKTSSNDLGVVVKDE